MRWDQYFFSVCIINQFQLVLDANIFINSLLDYFIFWNNYGKLFPNIHCIFIFVSVHNAYRDKVNIAGHFMASVQQCQFWTMWWQTLGMIDFLMRANKNHIFGFGKSGKEIIVMFQVFLRQKLIIKPDLQHFSLIAVVAIIV